MDLKLIDLRCSKYDNIPSLLFCVAMEIRCEWEYFPISIKYFTIFKSL